MPDRSQQEKEYQRNLAAQQRLPNLPDTNQENPEGQLPEQETEPPTAPTPAGVGAVGADLTEGKTPEQKIAEGFVGKLPFGKIILNMFPVLAWLIGFFKMSVFTPWGLAIPPLWAAACFLSFVGIRGIKIPFLPTKIPRTTAIEYLLANIIFLIEIAPIILIFAVIIAAVVYVKQNSGTVLFKTFFGPLNFIKDLIPYIIGS